LAGESHDRYAQAARIHALLAPELAAEGWDLVDVRIFRGGGRLQVRLYVDLAGEGRIDLDGCARASRTASMFLEEADPFSGPWVLEVSSPGIRRPLRTEAHFAAARGREVTVKWRAAGMADPAQLRGQLERIEDGVLVIQPPARQDEPGAPAPEPVQVPVASVLEANLEHDFDVQEVIRRDRRRKKQERQEQRQARRGRGRNRPGGPDRDDDDQERDGS